jgi:hypothetical protein
MLTDPWLWVLAVVALVVIVLGAVAWMLRRPRRITLERARKLFHLRREGLEHRFFVLAAQSGKPRGLEWVDCEFEDKVSFARDRHNGRLRAFVGVAIRFQAVEGGGMEDNPNVDNVRAASAVFLLDGDDWSTEGRVLFNLNPAQAIEHFRQELEVVE